MPRCCCKLVVPPPRHKSATANKREDSPCRREIVSVVHCCEIEYVIPPPRD
ncbi:hypothetical protein SESBI_49824 [Sesbania bispinosa]|nr:hypothetical protein SESBI_49824 [Sesbania bispinosa]